jgi:hypothetical protein
MKTQKVVKKEKKSELKYNTSEIKSFYDGNSIHKFYKKNVVILQSSEKLRNFTCVNLGKVPES